MRIIHAPIEVAGQVGLYCQELARRGHHCVGYSYFHTFQHYKRNIYPIDKYELMAIAGEAIEHFDLFHFHLNKSMIPGLDDLSAIADLGKPMFMHHWGTDVRMQSIAGKLNPYVYTGNSPSEEQIREQLKQVSRYISTAIVQDYEVYEYVEPYYEQVLVLPLAADLSRLRPYYPDEHNIEPLLIHAPTDPLFKGTEIIESTIDQLKTEFTFKYKRIEHMPHEQALALYREADLIIDQILCGSYGMLSVEAMALGKPVVAYVRDNLAETFGQALPICNAHPDNLYDVLKKLIVSGELRKRKGQEGRHYVELHHDSRKIGEKLIKYYNNKLT